MDKRPLTRLPSSGGLPGWQTIELLFSKHGAPMPPTSLRDELVGILGWAKFGQDVSDRADAVRSSRPSFGDTYYET